MPNSIDFYKTIFLHVIPVRIIVPWYQRERKHKDNREKEFRNPGRRDSKLERKSTRANARE